MTPPLFSPLADHFYMPGGQHGILLLHGFTACPSQMIPLARLLNEAGFSVGCVRLPGHGTSPADMKQSTWQQWLDTALDAARRMQAAFPVFTVAGLSMGGALSLIIARELNPHACVTLAAPTAAANPFARFVKVLHPLYPTVRTHSPREHTRSEYDLGYREYPTKKVADLNRIIALSNASLPFVTCPLLSVQSLRDKTIVPESMDTIQRRAASRVKEHLWLKEAPHVVTLSSELPLIADTMIRFLQANEG